MADYTVSIQLQAVDNASAAIQGLNAALQNVGAEGEKQKNQIPQQATAWQNYKSVVESVTSSINLVQTAMGMLGQGLEVVNLGENVHSVRLAFEALQGDTLTAANTLQVLRDATSGVVSDMDLMSATNRLQSMGLGDTAAEFGELIGMAQQLGSVMSPSASTAQNIDNFTLLLANQSVRRLDSFGISADAVRQRIEELKDAGMSAQEAFNVATLEQGRIALENLGEAATAGATNVDQLSTRWQNFFNTFAEGTADFVNQAAGTVEMLVAITDAQMAEGQATVDARNEIERQRQENIEAANQQHNQIVGGTAGVSSTDVTLTGFGGAYQGGTGGGDTLNQMAEAAAETNAALYEASANAATLQAETIAAKDATKEMTDSWRTGAAAVTDVAEAIEAAKDAAKDVADNWERGSVAAYDMAAAIEASKNAAKEIDTTASNWRTGSISLVSELDREIMSINASLAEMETTIIPLSQITGLVAQGADAMTASSAALSTAMSGYDMSSLDTTTYGTARGMIGDQQLFTAEEAAAAQQMAEYYSDLLADAELLHEQGLISDAELANVQAAADTTANLADNAERGVEAFRNMTLAQGLGVSGGGIGGEVAGDVEQYMQDNGYSAQQIAQYNQSAGLATGTQTQSSLAYDSTIVPMIADIAAQYGAQAAAQATMNVQQGMQTGAYMGMSDTQIASSMSGMTGYETQVASASGFQGLGTSAQGTTLAGATEGFDIDSYMTGLTEVDTTMQTIDASSANYRDNMVESGQAAHEINDTMTEASGGVRRITGEVQGLTSRFVNLNNQSVNMRANVEINFSNQGMLADFIRSVVAGSGGGDTEGQTIPGTDGGQ